MKISLSQRDLLLRAVLLVVFFAILSIAAPGFLSVYTISPIVDGMAVLGLLALGLAVTMLAGELDLSIASVAAAAAVVAVDLRGLGPVVAILVAVVAATLFGALQGYLVARLGISSLMLTLASFIGVRGLAHLLAGNSTVSLPPEDFPTIDFFDLPIAQFFAVPSLIAVSVFVLVGLFLGLTRWGREVYAIGGGREQSVGAGVPTRRPMAIAFAISGLSAGLVGALSTWSQGAAIPTGFESSLLPAATAALVGGIALSGGRGSVVNVLVGVLFIQTLTTFLSSTGAPAFAQSMLTGVLLFGVLLLEYVTDRRLRQRLSGSRRSRAVVRQQQVSKGVAA